MVDCNGYDEVRRFCVGQTKSILERHGVQTKVTEQQKRIKLLKEFCNQSKAGIPMTTDTSTANNRDVLRVREEPNSWQASTLIKQWIWDFDPGDILNQKKWLGEKWANSEKARLRPVPKEYHFIMNTAYLNYAEADNEINWSSKYLELCGSDRAGHSVGKLFKTWSKGDTNCLEEMLTTKGNFKFNAFVLIYLTQIIKYILLAEYN